MTDEQRKRNCRTHIPPSKLEIWKSKQKPAAYCFKNILRFSRKMTSDRDNPFSACLTFWVVWEEKSSWRASCQSSFFSSLFFLAHTCKKGEQGRKEFPRTVSRRNLVFSPSVRLTWCGMGFRTKKRKNQFSQISLRLY